MLKSMLKCKITIVVFRESFKTHVKRSAMCLIRLKKAFALYMVCFYVSEVDFLFYCEELCRVK